MDTSKFEKALKEALASKGNRKFTQSIDLIVNLKDIDLKKTDQHIDFFTILPHTKGKVAKICGLVGPELIKDAKEHLDFAIEAHEFEEYKKNPKKAKELAEKYDIFVAQGNIMSQVAMTFGKIFGPRGKMPNPKAGCVVPPKAALAQLKERLLNTCRISAKTSLSIKIAVGNEKQDEKEVMENISNIYSGIVSHTPQGENNVKEVILKLTMGKPARVQ